MSSTPVDQTLSQAYSLIEAGNPQEAKRLLQALTVTEKNNADVWWVYAHAVDEPDTARQALNNVLRIDPDYPGARDLLTTLENNALADDDFGFDINDDETSQIPAAPALPPTLPDLPQPQVKKLPSAKVSQPKDDFDFEDDFDDDFPPLPSAGADNLDDLSLDDFDDDEEIEEKESRGLGVWAALAIVIVIVLIGALLVIFNPFQTGRGAGIATPPPNTQQVAVIPTLPLTITSSDQGGGNTTSAGLVTDEPDFSQTEPAATLEPQTSDDPTPSPEDLNFGVQSAPDQETVDTLTNALTDFSLNSEEAFTTRQTTLGNTLLARICGVPGPEARSRLIDAMNVLGAESTNVEADVEALGAEIVDCDTDLTLLAVALPLSEAQAFAAGDVDESGFQAAWRAVR
jgi:hypothetical protein